MSVILGFDPGSLLCGWGVIASHPKDSLQTRHIASGVIDLRSFGELPERLGQLQLAVKNIFETYRPKDVAVEKVFLAKNPDSAFKLGHARGVLLAEAGLSGARLGEYAARHVKKVLTGNGAASKDEVQLWVLRLLQIKEYRWDATDALAIAICHQREQEIKRKLEAQL